MARKSAKAAPDTASVIEAAPPPRRAILWLSPDQTDLLTSVVQGAGLSVVAAGVSAGGARPDGATRPFADSLGAQPIDDLRNTLSTLDADLALLAADAPDSWSLLDDTELLRACAARSLHIVTMAPFPASVRDLGRDARADAPGAAVFAPLMRRSKGFRLAADALTHFGQVTTLDLSCRNGRGHGSLAARVFDAMDFVMATLGAPESIDASVRGPRAESGLRLAAGESLRDLRGDMTAHLRYSDGRSAAITLSDRAGRWFRGATLIGDSGCLRVDESAFEWLDATGELADSSSKRAGAKRAATNPAQPPGLVLALVEELTRLLDPRSPVETPTDLTNVLAMAEAALLSARTAQPESPATILRMAGSV